MHYQKTLKNQIELKGIGLHNGLKVNLCIKPSKVNSGIIFKRTDVDDDKNLIEASYKNVNSPILCTKIKNSYGVSISTIEHLMAAFYGEGIDNALVELDAPELPIMDGSAFDFVEAIKRSAIPVELDPGQFIAFDPRCLHGTQYNDTLSTRISIDVRVLAVETYKNMKRHYRGTGRRQLSFVPGQYFNSDPVGRGLI